MIRRCHRSSKMSVQKYKKGGVSFAPCRAGKFKTLFFWSYFR